MKTKILSALLLVAALCSSAFAQAEQSDMKVGVSVTSSSATLVPANSRRNYLAICNLAATNPMTCTTIGTATATNGYVIAASTCKIFDRKALAKRKFQCISASGTTGGYDEVVDTGGPLTAPTPTPIVTPTPTP